MKRQMLPTTVVVLATLLFIVAPGWAATAPPPSINSLTGTPTTFPPKVQAKVNLTVAVSNTTFNKSAVQVQRQQVDGSWSNYVKTDFLPTSNPLVFTGKAGFNEASTSKIRIRLAATFTSAGKNKFFSPVLELSVGQVVSSSGQDVTVPGPAGSGLSVTIPGGALTGPTSVGIGPAPTQLVDSPLNGRPRAATVDIIFQPVSQLDPQALTAPLIVSVPPPPNTPPGALFYFATPVTAPVIGGPGGLDRKLVVIDTGTVVNGQIVTQGGTIFEGIFEGGTYAVLQEIGSGVAVGKVCDASVAGACDGNTTTTPSPGTWVQERKTSAIGGEPAHNTDNLGAYTDALGRFKIAVQTASTGADKDKFNLDVIDGLRCATFFTPTAQAQGAGNVTENVFINVARVAPSSSTIVFEGVRNGGFEKMTGFDANNLDTCWKRTGTVSLIKAIRDAQGNFVKTVYPTTPTPTDVAFRDLFGFGTTIQPSEADQFIEIRSEGGSIEQTFKLPLKTDDFSGVALSPPALPPGFQTLHFDFHFVCASNLVCTGLGTPTTGDSRLNDTLTVTLTSTSGFSQTFAAFGGQLGWRTGQITIPDSAAGTTVTLKFTATNLDSDKQSAVLIDNVRFDTLFVQPTILSSVALAMSDVEEQIRHANEILSQTATNVRIRSPLTTSLPQVGAPCTSGTDLLTLDISSATPLSRTNAGGEMIWGLCRSAQDNPQNGPNSDVEILYVTTLNDVNTSDPGVFGVAVTREDYAFDGTLIYNFDPAYPTPPTAAVLNMKTGIILRAIANTPATSNMDRFRETLAHELGHMLISKQRSDTTRPLAGSTVEHNTVVLGAQGTNIATDQANIMYWKNCNPDSTGTTAADTICHARVKFQDSQRTQWELPSPKPGPSCPNVTCPH